LFSDKAIVATEWEKNKVLSVVVVTASPFLLHPSVFHRNEQLPLKYYIIPLFLPQTIEGREPPTVIMAQKCWAHSFV